MQYLRSTAVTLVILTIVFLFSSCGGGSSSSVGPITSITLTPSPNISLNGGDTVQFSVAATDARGRLVQNQTFTYNTNPTGIIQIANGGNLPGLICAGGQWLNSSGANDLTNPVVCAPFIKGAAFNAGQTTVTVTAQGVTSNAVTVSVHPKVARVVLSAASSGCVSQFQSATYTVQAFDSNNALITNQIGNFTWIIADSSVGTLTNTSTPPDSSGQTSTNTVNAVIPGITTVTVTANSTNPVNSNAVPFQECPVANITISPNPVFSPSPGGIGATGQLSATVTDINSATVANVPLTWTSSQPVVASVNSSGLVTAANFGTSNITASCALNSTCNKNQGVLVTSNTATASVGPGATGTTVYATGSLNGNTALIPIPNTTNTAGTTIALPFTPNSLVFDPQGANAYLGSGSGLMVVNATNNTFTKTVTNATGKVLAVSPDGTKVLIGGTGFATLLYNASASTVTTLSNSGAVAGDFSPDSSVAIVADATGVRVIQNGVVRTVSNTVVPTDVSFLATGALAYLAANATPSVVACNNTIHNGGASGTPTRVKSLPDGSKVLGAALPNLVVVGVATGGNMCPPTITETPSTATFTGGTTANQIIVTPDGSHAYVTSDLAGKLLSYNVAGNTTGAVNLVGTSPVATTGGVTLDSASVYVGVNDGGTGSVHQIDVASGNDIAQISVTFIPDLVAVRPH